MLLSYPVDDLFCYEIVVFKSCPVPCLPSLLKMKEDADQVLADKIQLQYRVFAVQCCRTMCLIMLETQSAHYS